MSLIDHRTKSSKAFLEKLLLVFVLIPGEVELSRESNRLASGILAKGKVLDERELPGLNMLQRTHEAATCFANVTEGLELLAILTWYSFILLILAFTRKAILKA